MDYKEYIALVNAKIGILDVIGHYVKLHRQGRNYIGLCPFHHEKTPSFTVSPDKGMFYCFGCKASGDMLTFVRRVHNVSLPEAVEVVAKEFNVELPPWRLSTAASRERQELLQTLKTAAVAFAAALADPTASECQQYVRNRSIPPDVVETFELGYCPRDIRSIVTFCSERGVTEDNLVRASIIQRHAGGIHTPFSHRLIFPIWDAIGNIIAFGGRAIDATMPKYINSPETPLFAKRRTLYALPLAEPSIRKTATAVVVEGYMDAISLHASGFSNTVASLGTAFTDEQATLLRRSASRVLLNFDSDEAGQRAARQALSIADRTGLDVAIIRLSGAKDPDELVHEPDGKNQYQKALDGAAQIGDFLIDIVSAGKDLSSLAGRRTFVQEMMESVDSLQDSLLRAQLLTKVAQRVGLRETEVAALYRKGAVRSDAFAPADPWRIPRKNLRHPGLPTSGSLESIRSSIEQELMAALVQNLDKAGELVAHMEDSLVRDETCREILAVLRRDAAGGAPSVSSLIAQLGSEAAALVGQWSLEPSKRDYGNVGETTSHKLDYRGAEETIERLRSLSSQEGQQGTMPHAEEVKHD